MTLTEVKLTMLWTLLNCEISQKDCLSAQSVREALHTQCFLCELASQSQVLCRERYLWIRDSSSHRELWNKEVRSESHYWLTSS